MRAMILERQGQRLELASLPDPQPGPGQLLLEVQACGVCRTDLHLRDSEIPATKLPVVLGHQIVATTPDGVRVGVPWLGWTDGTCQYCTSGRENLCVNARFTGRDIDGGYARAHRRRRAFLPATAAGALRPGGSPAAVWRADRLPRPDPHGRRPATGAVWVRVGRAYDLPARGIPGAAGVRVHETRDEPTQAFARGLGGSWAGGSDEAPPEPLDAAIIFAPAGPLVPKALEALAPDGVVVCAGIYMSDIPSFPYELLYHERKLRSVANLTRSDGEEFLAIAPKVPIRTTVTLYELERAEEALADLRAGRFEGTAVIVP